jgi:hypothetical protein
MDTEEALQVADKAADRNTPAADHPSIVNMVYALEILANGYRAMQEKAQAWEQSYRSQTYAHDQRARKLRDVRDIVQRLNELVEFMRTALGLDAHALDDPNRARRILGGVFADARMWARVKDMAGGKFVAGDVVTADVMNAVSEAVKSSRETDTGTMESLTVRLDANESVKVNSGGVYVAPVGTDPKDTGKWTFLGTTPRGGVFVEFRKRSVANLAAEVSMPPAVQLFPIGSPEPDKRVTMVECYRMARPMRFERVAVTLSGDSLWRNMDDSTLDAPLWLWKDVNSESVVEIR